MQQEKQYKKKINKFNIISKLNVVNKRLSLPFMMKTCNLNRVANSFFF